MIDFRTSFDEVRKISSYIERMSCEDIHAFTISLYGKRAPSVYGRHETDFFSNDSVFGFHGSGRPTRHVELGRPNSDDELGVMVQIQSRQNTTRVVVSRGDCHEGISFVFDNQCKISQIYITCQKPYSVTALGKSFKINPAKHPELFLTQENTSYAMLLGEEVILNLPEYISMLRTIVEFALVVLLLKKERNNY
mgnify:CR=1 FL=1